MIQPYTSAFDYAAYDINIYYWKAMGVFLHFFLGPRHDLSELNAF